MIEDRVIGVLIGVTFAILPNMGWIFVFFAGTAHTACVVLGKGFCFFGRPCIYDRCFGK